MRISDWSSDVCSSDLMLAMRHLPHRVLGILLSSAPAFAALAGFLVLGERLQPIQWTAIAFIMLASAGGAATARRPDPHGARGRSEERRVGNDGVGRVDIGGRRLLENKQTKPNN